MSPVLTGVRTMTAQLQARFQTILPRIELHARIYFRHVKCPGKRQDAIAETVAVSWKWFIRTTEQGKNPAEFVTALATYAARHVRSGRRLCGQERSKDALSPLAQQRRHFTVSSLPDFSTLSDNPFSEALSDNTRSSVPDQVCFRLDFPAWLTTLSARNREIALDMAQGHSTQELARKYGTSEGRISQLRREFHTAWQRYCAVQDEREAA